MLVVSTVAAATLTAVLASQQQSHELQPAAQAALAATTSAHPSRQQNFARAAKAYHVPESLLLAVSYLESGWNANAGHPSVSAGYGPMHLVDGTLTRAVRGIENGTGDPRGEGDRRIAAPRITPAKSPASRSLQQAARRTGIPVTRLRTDPAANIVGGAALLAAYQRALHHPLSQNPAAWQDALAAYGTASGGASPTASSPRTGGRWFAEQVYSVMRSGAARRTDDGEALRLSAQPALRAPARVKRQASEADCPAALDCSWVPSPYVQLDPNDSTKYGNHDISQRPRTTKIKYIVIHDTEATYDQSLQLAQDKNYLAWDYTIRSADGAVAQHLRAKDIGWHAGNWYVNTTSIGVEHEGVLAQGGTWYTEAMYRSSAQLVRYLAARYDIPLDRGHILGHDMVPGQTTGAVAQQHVDPGPYWDWTHYFDLLGKPLKGTAKAGSTGMVMIRPEYAANTVPFTGCDKAGSGTPCPEHGSSAVVLRTAPNESAPLVKDVAMHTTNDGTATMDVADMGAHAAAGQRFLAAGRQGDWTAIWYLGQRAWFHDPASAPASVPVKGIVAVPRPGVGSVPVYGWPLPEASAYPKNVPVQQISALPYQFTGGQGYAVSGGSRGQYYYAKTFNLSEHVMVQGKTAYYQIQIGHRMGYVKTSDVSLRAG
ncbi:N-acetylmuramoyl-L-alanine amidase [Actinomadura darangshiensis]|uniref:N-acetylmuramoyl-L-alanine amidase n=1 Tax=Actinomadura darangshiensis TaxID=705336 RepID=A0A4R5A2W2_9ACTN|nr:N-acetylmuramoyl-L-alanine amidase [Actinomadura darangshiensis]TDD63832.1 N-acetylmuramoyl-L-alanine amidase [Actinomadura darangshiensis]